MGNEIEWVSVPKEELKTVYDCIKKTIKSIDTDNKHYSDLAYILGFSEYYLEEGDWKKDG